MSLLLSTAIRLVVAIVITGLTVFGHNDTLILLIIIN